MTRIKPLLLWCAVAAILWACKEPCRGWSPHWSSSVSRRVRRLTTDVVTAQRHLAVWREAVGSRELQTERFGWASEAGWRRALEILRKLQNARYDASRMDWAWWSNNIKGASSTIDVICVECAHRSESTTLNRLQSGQSPGCFCNGAVPWSSREGHARCLAMLKSRYGDQYDASRMDWAWWSNNIMDALSTIDVICGECGHRSESTTLNSLQKGQSPGCFCNRAVPWSSREGHARCLAMLKSRYGEQYDASRMDWAWWRNNIKGASSTIDVTCRECGHRSESTTLNRLQSGQSPGCFCKRAVPWSSREGHARCLAMLKSRYGEQYDASRMDWAWWSNNIKGASSTIDVTCRECGHRSEGTTLSSLQSGQSPGCFCNGAVPWSSREGHARCLAMLESRYGEQYDASRMDWAWWSNNIMDALSTIDVMCGECGHRSESTTLNRLQKGQSPGCFCNRAVPWSSREGHARCLAMLKSRYGEQYDASRMDWAWWSNNIMDALSTIDVICGECGHRSESTTLSSLQKGQGPGCLCNRRTEAKLERWLVATFPSGTVTSQVRGCTNPGTQRPLPFDFGLCNDTVLIELDGDIGHFGRGWRRNAADDGGVPQRDLQKELWAMQEGKVVIRLLQEDVYSDSWAWGDFLTSAIQHATCSAQPCVLTQDAAQYEGGIYRKLRADFDCTRGHFLPSGISYLGYGLARQKPHGTKPPGGALSLSRLDASSCKQGSGVSALHAALREALRRKNTDLFLGSSSQNLAFIKSRRRDLASRAEAFCEPWVDEASEDFGLIASCRGGVSLAANSQATCIAFRLRDISLSND